MKKTIFILILSAIGLQGFSQQDPQFSLYMFNPLGVNPGYTGSREVMSAVLIHRSQWIGLDGAPETQVLSINTPLKNKKMGLGLQIINDKIGPKTTQNITASYAYRLKLGRGKLAFGLRAGILNYNYDWNKIEYKDQNDQIPNTAAESFILPVFDFGVYYNTNTFYAGVSFDHINEAKFNLINVDTITSDARVYSSATGTLGKAFILNSNLVLKTSAILRVSNGTGTLAVNGSILLKNKILFGLTLSKNTITVITELNITKNLKMGIAYEVDGSEVAKTSSGSFEFFVGYDLNLFKSKVVSPRYF
jgi:type IX secretion system PorP/SprF family membrane protein